MRIRLGMFVLCVLAIGACSTQETPRAVPMNSAQTFLGALLDAELPDVDSGGDAYIDSANLICEHLSGGLDLSTIVDALMTEMTWQHAVALSIAAVDEYCPQHIGSVEAFLDEVEGKGTSPTATSELPLPPPLPALPPPPPAQPPPAPVEPEPEIVPTRGASCTDVGYVGVGAEGQQLVCDYTGNSGPTWINTVLVGVNEEWTPCDPDTDNVSRTSDGRAVLCADGTWRQGP